jgi:hypothetical protein
MCNATMGHDGAGHQILTFALSQYISELATQLAVKRGPLIGRLCLSGDQTISISPNTAEQSHFTLRFRDAPADATKQVPLSQVTG